MTRKQRVAILLACSALGGCHDRAALEAQRSAAPAGNVTLARLISADREPGAWFTSGRDLGRTYHSPLTIIDRGNVARLGLAWQFETGTRRGLEATPLVVDGVLYTSGVAGRVYALDAASGKEIWRFEPPVDMQYYRLACCDAVNRGVAVWEGVVYVVSLDGWMYALDAVSGQVRWRTDTIVDRRRSYASTGAPAIAGDLVVIGNGGAEFDARGYVSAFDRGTGKLRWRFFTVPGPPGQPYEHPELEVAAKTWDPNSRWDLGGGGTVWDAIVYDPELELLYVGTGNGAPQSQPTRSPAGGDNLFLTSILALQARTGRMAWYMQQVPGDGWDYTATQPMILADLTIDGAPQKVLMQAPKNGLFYVIERRTGRILSAKPFVPINWLQRLDLATGRATVNRQVADYSREVRLVFPSGQGGHNWNPMSFDARRGLVYIPAIEIGEYLLQPTEPLPYRRHARNMGRWAAFSEAPESALQRLPASMQQTIRSGRLKPGQPDTRMRAVLRAFDPLTGKIAWEQESHGGFWDRAGVLSTDGGLVFQGTGTGRFRAFDADNGRLLLDLDVGTAIIAAPMTYLANGEQYVAVMAGWGGAGWYNQAPNNAASIYGNQGRILAFRLGGGTVPKPALLPALPPVPEPPLLRADAATLERGSQLFGAYCMFCHSDSERTGSADLRRMSPAVHSTFDDIVLRGMRVPLGMPRFDDALDRSDADAIHQFLISRARQAYEAAVHAGAVQ